METSETTPPNRPQSARRAGLILISLVATFVCLRAYLHVWPNTDFNLGPYNIHHLYVGLLLIMFCGIPLTVLRSSSRYLDLATIGFGAGLSMALDEWVFLIVTDGSNASYLLPISFWGGVVMIGVACGYVVVLFLVSTKYQSIQLDQPLTQPDWRLGSEAMNERS